MGGVTGVMSTLALWPCAALWPLAENSAAIYYMWYIPIHIILKG